MPAGNTSLQEYFFKSHESLATVIDFVEETLMEPASKYQQVSAPTMEPVFKNHQATTPTSQPCSGSTQSSPREPPSRRTRAHKIVRRFTP